MKKIKGDLIELTKQGQFDVIVQGCNCFNTMGSGIAAQLRKNWPKVYEKDCETLVGDKNKLGSFTVHRQSFVNLRTSGFDGSVCEVRGRVFYVINAYTQYGFGIKKDHFEYDAFQTFLYSFKNYIELMSFSNIRQNETGSFQPVKIIQIGFPMIGAGLAGGNWERIERMLRDFAESVSGVATVTIVEYDGSVSKI